MKNDDLQKTKSSFQHYHFGEALENRRVDLIEYNIKYRFLAWINLESLDLKRKFTFNILAKQ